MMDNRAEIASIGEELDENFLFNDSDSLNRSVTSLASLASSTAETSSSKHVQASKPRSRGFTISRLWRNKERNKTENQQTCPCPDCASTSKLSTTVQGTTCTTSTAGQNVPKIKCSMISSPTSPEEACPGGVASSWTYGYQIPLKHNNSFCSVDEEEDDEFNIEGSRRILQPSPPSKSRLSLNLVGKEKNLGTSPKSPKKLSKFFRSSFSKLLQLSSGNANNEADVTPPSGRATPASSLGLRQGRSITSLDNVESSPDEYVQPVNPADVMTPTTLAYLEEAKSSGLPVIPFAYPTCVLIDKMKVKQQQPDVMKAANASKIIDTKKKAVSDYMDFGDQEPKSPPGTLESIVGMAQRQYREEQPDDLELEEDFFCGSVGSVSTLSESMKTNASRPRSRIVQANWDQAEADAAMIMESDLDLKWHDYLDMTKKYNVGRSEPISIKEIQY